MKGEKNLFPDINAYIAAQPASIQPTLEKFRKTIKKAAPDAAELISYQMPAFKFKGMLVYFAAYKKHIGFYPTRSGIENFKKELSVYKGATGSVQFPVDKPLPLKLISEIVAFRVKENIDKAAMKKK